MDSIKYEVDHTSHLGCYPAVGVCMVDAVRRFAYMGEIHEEEGHQFVKYDDDSDPVRLTLDQEAALAGKTVEEYLDALYS